MTHHLSCLSQAPPTTLTWRLVLGHGCLKPQAMQDVGRLASICALSPTGPAGLGSPWLGRTPATPPHQFTVSSKGNEGALSQVRFSGAGEDVAMEDGLHLQAPAGVRTRTAGELLEHFLHTPPCYTGRERTAALSRYRRGSD